MLPKIYAYLLFLPCEKQKSRLNFQIYFSTFSKGTKIKLIQHKNYRAHTIINSTKCFLTFESLPLYLQNCQDKGTPFS